MPRLALGLVFAGLLGACSNLAYYGQAIGGHLQVMHAARPIPRLLDDPTTEPGLRTQLEKVAAIREFASRELGLPDNGSYRAYADLGRPYVVWNVFAARPFSIKPEEWCLFIVGCVNYRGYYDRGAAERFAAGFREQGLETYVADIPAYSTLGFFNDPVLNTFLRFGEQEVARIVFHELAHQLVFVAGDSAFNESFAATVENEGMRRWLRRVGTPEQRQRFELWQGRKAQFLRLVADGRERLGKIYAQPIADEEKARAKVAILDELQRTYAGLRSEWGPSGYDDFFGSGLNNAKLGAVSIYTGLVPAFQALLEAEGNDLPRFYRRAAALAGLSKAERKKAIERLSGSPAMDRQP